MASITELTALVTETAGDALQSLREDRGELSIDIESSKLLEVCRALRDANSLKFEQLIDVCGVDYVTFAAEDPGNEWTGARYAVVYHLLSVSHNHRLRVRTYLEDDFPKVASVCELWASANWFEREAFDMFGIVFEGHPDLRRLLTDYGFIGHPFRKDFPLSGHVEMRYDVEKGRVVYQPVSIEPRVLVQRVIREEGFGGRNT